MNQHSIMRAFLFLRTRWPRHGVEVHEAGGKHWKTHAYSQLHAAGLTFVGCGDGIQIS